jgi:Mrp family chromosome partitioning ATPase
MHGDVGVSRVKNIQHIVVLTLKRVQGVGLNVGQSWATMNLKGGVGKTTLTANICRAICDIAPLKILIVDTDPQCSLTLVFRTEGQVDQIPEHKTFYSLLWSTQTACRRR